MCHLDRACYLENKTATERIVKDVFKPSNIDQCPKCGCQTKDPFGQGMVIHDVSICKGLKTTRLILNDK